MMRQLRAPAARAARTYSSPAVRQDLSAHDPGQPSPADEGEDRHDREIDVVGRPGRGNRGRQRQPQRDVRERQQQLDEALDDVVDHAAEVARRDAEDQAQHHGYEGSDQRNREADLSCLEDARQQISAEHVGTQQEEGAALLDADEPRPRRDHEQDPVRLTANEETDAIACRPVLLIVECQGLRIHLPLVRVGKRGGEPARFVEHPDALRRSELDLAVKLVERVGAEERRKDRQRVEHDQDDAAHQRPGGSSESGARWAARTRLRARRRGRLRGAGPDSPALLFPGSWVLHQLRAAAAAHSSRMRGSSHVKAMSAIKLPRRRKMA